MKKKQLTTMAVAGVLAAGVLTYGGISASADGGSTDYTITIPATLTVNNAGWNATTGITASNSTNNFDNSKRLTVTATSANNWALESGNNSVGYNLATGTGTYNREAAPASWVFSASELNEAGGTNKGMGIIVDNYDGKPAGEYTDTVTFTAKVETEVQAGSISYVTNSVSKNTDDSAFTNPLSITGDGSVSYSSSDTSVATVDASTGEVTIVGAGTATITATVTDSANYTYSDKSATYSLEVTEAAIAVSGITIDNAPTEALFVNSTGTLTATVLPDNATDKTFTWSSSDSCYVSINAETGEYTIMGTKGYGSATITATANDGSGVTATCTITGKVTYTSLSVGTVLHVGDTFYTGGTVAFQTSPFMSFNASNGVITVVEDTSGSSKCYKFKRGSNGTKPNVTTYKVKDNTDGVYITGGSGTNDDRFTLAVHTAP